MENTHKVTLRDLAHEAGLSVSTVSRALSGSPLIAEQTRIMVTTLAANMGYRPNAQARALRSAVTHTIGLVVPTIMNPYFAALADSIQKTTMDYGYTAVMGSSRDDPESLIKTVRLMEDQRVDGMVVVPHPGTGAVLRAVAKRGTPVVLVDRECPPANAPSIVSDATVGFRYAIGELVDRNLGPIGYLSGPLDTSTAEGRLKVFIEQCEHQQISNPGIYHGGFEAEQGYLGAKTLINQGVRALIAGDSLMTIGALTYCREAGLTIGVDIALVGFDDFALFRLLERPLSIIDQPIAKMGEVAVTLLLEHLQSGNVDELSDERIVLPTRYISRQSTTFNPSKMCSPGETSSHHIRQYL